MDAILLRSLRDRNSLIGLHSVGGAALTDGYYLQPLRGGERPCALSHRQTGEEGKRGQAHFDLLIRGDPLNEQPASRAPLSGETYRLHRPQLFRCLLTLTLIDKSPCCSSSDGFRFNMLGGD
jgi:hypothetical protein